MTNIGADLHDSNLLLLHKDGRVPISYNLLTDTENSIMITVVVVVMHSCTSDIDTLLLRLIHMIYLSLSITLKGHLTDTENSIMITVVVVVMHSCTSDIDIYRYLHRFYYNIIINHHFIIYNI